VLFNFNGENGKLFLTQLLIFDAAGNLYGTTQTGGTLGGGTVVRTLTGGRRGLDRDRGLFNFSKPRESLCCRR